MWLKKMKIFTILVALIAFVYFAYNLFLEKELQLESKKIHFGYLYEVLNNLESVETVKFQAKDYCDEFGNFDKKRFFKDLKGFDLELLSKEYSRKLSLVLLDRSCVLKGEFFAPSPIPKNALLFKTKKMALVAFLETTQFDKKLYIEVYDSVGNFDRFFF